ncbi:MAG: NADH-quinone oxidoreductase subunit A [Actinomycetota bacterium]|nr:NADH-quinone oxidoreductase subunit A [Actinomycetota bacterium]
MLAEYLPLLVLFVLAAAFVGVSMLVSARLGPNAPNPAKTAAYESGIIPEPETDVRGSRFPVKFYLVAMLFIVFDVEAVFIYPWAVTLRSLGWYGLAVMGVFVALLFESYYYVLRRGGLEWD